MKLHSLALTLLLGLAALAPATLAAQMNPTFFPDFQAYPGNPIIRYGDGFADAAWNDPVVLKQNGQYIMYNTAAVGIFLTPGNTVKVYRHVSSDGYNWTLSPTTPVISPAPGTYYDGGTETPSVVYFDSLYHMYLTCYPPGNDQTQYVIAHATSPDGIAWTMDATPILESDGSPTLYGDLVGEPGAVVYHDSIYVFFTAAGTVAGIPMTSIGLMKSADGTQFGAPSVAVTLPTDVYPYTSGYWGLSTPSALAINDSLYLFTDVAQTINGNWTQVALHQFKTDGVSGVWYHDSVPIHTMQDFPWTDGDYLSNLLAITPLMDDNGLLRIWYSGQHLADINGVDTTYNVFFDSLGVMHVDPYYYGIGTSSYQFNVPNALADAHMPGLFVRISPQPAGDLLQVRSEAALHRATLSLHDLQGRRVRLQEGVSGYSAALPLQGLLPGIYLLRIQSGDRFWSGKVLVGE